MTEALLEQLAHPVDTAQLHPLFPRIEALQPRCKDEAQLLSRFRRLTPNPNSRATATASGVSIAKTVKRFSQIRPWSLDGHGM
jgi:hypothetical protein